MKEYQMIINGKDVGAGLPLTEVVNPATGEVMATIPRGGEEQAKLAVDAAYAAFEEWSQLTAYERGDMIRKWHDLIDENAEDLATTMTTEQGKPLVEARAEIGYANGFFAWYAEEGKRIYGEMIPATSKNKRL